jgi:hypothetical protein
MLIQQYSAEELHFAYCYRVYMRWRTHFAKPYRELQSLDKEILRQLGQAYGIHVLECATTATDVLTEISLKPSETISAAASKLKGKVSSWLRQEIALEKESRLGSWLFCLYGWEKHCCRS